MYAYFVRLHWTTYKCNLHATQFKYTHLLFIQLYTGLMTHSWAAPAAVTKCSLYFVFVRFTSYGVLLRDFEWTSATTITAIPTWTKSKREQQRSKKWNKKNQQQQQKKKNYARFRSNEWVRKWRHIKKTEKRIIIKCHNSISSARGDRAYNKSFRSFNLFDENHLFFSFS